MKPADNPLLGSSAHPPLYVAQGGGPYANTRRALEPLGLAPVRGKRVLLKPNVGRVASCGSGVVTNPQVVAAAIDAFREAGAEVAVGESPIVGVDVQEAFAAAGRPPLPSCVPRPAASTNPCTWYVMRHHRASVWL